MHERTEAALDGWEGTSVDGGADVLEELAERNADGALGADESWAFLANGRVVGTTYEARSLDAVMDGAWTMLEAPERVLPVLLAMLERRETAAAQYYTRDQPLKNTHRELGRGEFTGYVELSENVVSGDYYLVYQGGHAASVAFVGPSGRLVTGDDALDRAADEVGIYEVYPVDLDVVDPLEELGDDQADLSPRPGTSNAVVEAGEDQRTGGGDAGRSSGGGGGSRPVAGGDGPSVDLAEDVPSPPSLDAVHADFETVEALGQGGNADVHEAVHDPTGRTVALKVPRFQGTLSESAFERFRKEAEYWARLDDHDHVVGVLDWGEEPLPWIALEYMDGGNLTDRVDDLDLPARARTAVYLARALTHAHRQGVAHLDLKPENVLFREGEDGLVPKVGDWGLAKLMIQDTGTVEGLSPAYAAPEQFDSEAFGEPGQHTDVYQFGAVCQLLFTGVAPFEGSAVEVMRRVVDGDFELPTAVDDSLPGAVDDVVRKAMATDPGDRYEDVLYLRDDLEALYADVAAASGAGGTATNGSPPTGDEGAAEPDATESRDDGPTGDAGDDAGVDDVGGAADREAEDTADGEEGAADGEEGAADGEEGAADGDYSSGDDADGGGERTGTAGASHDEVAALTPMERSEALSGTSLFVRYRSKNDMTLEDVRDGNAAQSAVRKNMQLECHTEFDADGVAVDGQHYDDFLPDTVDWRVVEWLLTDLPFELRDGGHESDMRGLYEAIPEIDRAELSADVVVESNSGSVTAERRRELRSFDVALRDRRGEPLVVVDVNDSREPADRQTLERLVEKATDVKESNDDLVAALLATSSYFEPGALEAADEATDSGLLGRGKPSYVKVSRGTGFHLGLVEMRDDDCHLNLPDL